ncbi:hypothetical protein D7Z54_14360 [Salibacterium salarium]|uniref:Type IV pilus assembly protein PilO n=1 Tax=Salibacterium salarium TaxID=284579 RepID=A0A3R9QKV3_9BACI|nr:hypothetical protein [Salibacterium salarium]RSL32630.1 hypothetical protein D7Z54_14360 [Salibacterium salarium]
MRVNIERIHWVMLLLGAILIVGFGVLQYITTIQPLQADQQSLNEEVEILENRLGEAERENVSTDDDTADLYSLQRELPLQPLTDELLLELDRAEEMSGSYILSAEKLDAAEQSAAQEESGETGQASGIDVSEGALLGEEPETDQTEAGPVVKNRGEAATLSYLVRVRTPQYENLQLFLESLDQSIRLMNIDMLTFDGKQEQVWVDEEPSPLTITIMLTAFYYPDTEQLEERDASSSFDESPEKDNPILQDDYN